MPIRSSPSRQSVRLLAATRAVALEASEERLNLVRGPLGPVARPTCVPKLSEEGRFSIDDLTAASPCGRPILRSGDIAIPVRADDLFYPVAEQRQEGAATKDVGRRDVSKRLLQWLDEVRGR